MTDAVILGHSFIRRLSEKSLGSWSNFGFDTTELRIHSVARGGLTLDELISPRITDEIRRIQPTIIAIQIGENDLDSPDFDVKQQQLALNITSVAQWLVAGFSVRHVIILQLLHRVNTRHVPSYVYNRSIDSVNASLKARCTACSNCSFWWHKGLTLESLRRCHVTEFT